MSSDWPRRLAIVTVGAIFCLIIVGGLVHNTDSSLACGTDWPLCRGEVFPKLTGGVIYEWWLHRVGAVVIGLLILSLTIALFTGRSWRWGLWGLGAIGIFSLQALLGRLTVRYGILPPISTAHLAVSLLLLSYLLVVALRLGGLPSLPLARSSRRFAWAVAILVYFQALVGALMRHLGAGLACLELPLCRATLWPSEVHPNVLLHQTHRLLGVAVALAVLGLAVPLLRSPGRLRAFGIGLLTIVLGQVTLGVASILTLLDVAPRTAHLGGAALLLSTLVALLASTRSVPSAAKTVPLGAPATA